jgi:hypothetical protein
VRLDLGGVEGCVCRGGWRGAVGGCSGQVQQGALHDNLKRHLYRSTCAANAVQGWGALDILAGERFGWTRAPSWFGWLAG